MRTENVDQLKNYMVNEHYYMLNEDYVDKDSSNKWLSYGGSFYAEAVSEKIAI